MNKNGKYSFPVSDFAGRKTPFYYYDMTLLADTLSAVKKAVEGYPFKVHYAVKACVDTPVLRMISDAGFGADVVSGGELKAAVEAGFKPSSIVFAGVGKSDEEIESALDAGIGCFNVESLEELEVIAEIAAGRGVKAPVALRVNPEIDAHTHHYITTGLAENKFGIAMTMLDEAIDFCRSHDSLELRGLHFHIGSQIEDMKPFEILCERINGIVALYRDKGVKFSSINVGGGLGIDYDNPEGNPIPDFAGYFDVFKRCLRLEEGQEVHFELGRSLVAQCGSLVTRVLYVKKGVEKEFVIVDAGMTDLIRPALYQAHHAIRNITSGSDVVKTYDVVGPVCESSDVFGRDEQLPATRRGDLLVMRSAGAYGRIMASAYNCRSIPAAMFSQENVE